MGTLVLGIGNTIMTDDGIGPVIVERLKACFGFPEDVQVIDGGTLGLDLLPLLEGVENLLIVDAIETGASPGTLQRITGDDVPAAMATKLSPHQIGVQDLLAVAALQGNCPGNVTLLGVQPCDIGLGTDLTPAVAEKVEALVERVLAELEGWGVKVARL